MKSSSVFLIAFGLGTIVPVSVAAMERSLSTPVLWLWICGVLALLIWATVLAHKESISGSNLEQINAWYKRMDKDTDAVFGLVQLYEGGENKSFFAKHPKQARYVFDAAHRLVELVETGRMEDKKPELEDYYWLGLMYEEGFACQADFAQAIAYYQKALSTSQCWDLDPKHYKQLRAEVEKRLAALQQK